MSLCSLEEEEEEEEEEEGHKKKYEKRVLLARFELAISRLLSGRLNRLATKACSYINVI